MSWRKRVAQSIAWRRNPVLYSLISLILVSLISITSSMGTLLIANNSFDYPIMIPVYFGMPAVSVWAIGAAVGISTTLLVLWFFRKSDDIFELIAYRPFSKGRVFREIVIFFLVISAVFAAPIISWSFYFLDQAGLGTGSVEKFFREIFSFLDVHAGGTVSFAISVISVIAFVILIQQLRDIQGSVSSFSDMIDRIERLMRECSHESPIHMISYTPAIGFLALPSRYQKRLFGLMTKTDPNGQSEIRMLVLGETQLAEWHGEFSGRVTRLGKITQREVDDAQQKSIQIKTKLRACPSERSYGEVIREAFPGYYCFFTERRAIVVTPFFLPIPNQSDEQREILPAPNMVGYETSDRTTLDYLKQQFGYLEQFAIWGSPPSSVNGDSSVEGPNQIVP